MYADGALAEALYGGEDIVCALGPVEWLWFGVVGVDVGFDPTLPRWPADRAIER